MNKSSMVRPSIKALNPEQIHQIHSYSLEILSTTGVKAESEAAVKVYERSHGTKIVDGNRVLIEPDLVEWALSAAPPAINIYDRNGNQKFRLGDDRNRFGMGVTAQKYQDPISNELIPFSREHMKKLVRLGDSLPNFDVISTPGVLHDIPAKIADLYATLDMAANTQKPLIVLVSEDNYFSKTLDLLEHLFGDIASKPSFIPYFNPVTPLVLNRGTTDKMVVAIERGLPFALSSFSMMGATTPITPAGTLAITNAELLSGLVLSQLLKEGTPIIMGILPAYMDMKTMVNFYDPVSWLTNLACAEMMDFYNIPHCGTSGSSMGWGGDFLVFENYWMNHLLGTIGKAGLTPFIGVTLTGKSFSPVNAVYSNDVIEQVLRIFNGFELGEDAVGLADIAEVGPGGHFLKTKLTRKNYRDAYYDNDTFPHLSLANWQELGKPKAMDKLISHTVDLLNSQNPPEGHAELIAKGEKYIKSIIRQRN
jgi:trimethylamine--corrinoid protein Co-methyltransferase